MARPPSSTLDLVPRRTRDAWAFAALVGLAGALVAAFYGGLIGSAKSASGASLGLLSLKPYLDPSWPPFSIPLAAFFSSPAVLALGVGLGAAALVLVCDAVCRRIFFAPKPGAAALAAVAVLLAPAWGIVLRVEGHQSLVGGFVLSATGCLLILDYRGGTASLVGALLVAGGVVAHPAWAPALIVLLACARSWMGFAVTLAALIVGGGIAMSYWGALPDAPPSLAFAERLRFALQDLAAAPMLAFSPWRRLDIPTGYEALTSFTPLVIAGAFVHALALGIGMMIGGVRAGLLTAAGVAASVLGAALTVRGYVPGDRAFVLPAMIAYAPLVALILAVVPPRLARAALPGVVLGVATVAVLVASDRAPVWTRLGAALDLARERHPVVGDITAIHLEKDPARLVMFLVEIGTTDAYSPILVQTADKLIDGDSPALSRSRLKEIVDQKMNRAGRRRTDPEFDRMVAEVDRELRLAESMYRQGPAFHFEEISDAIVQVHTKVLDLHFRWPHEFATVKALDMFRKMAQNIIPTASRAGYYEYSLPLLEAIQLLGPELPETAAMIAIQKHFVGDPAALDELRAVLPKLPPKGPYAGLARGIIGKILLEKGDAAAALKDLQPSWTLLGAGGVKVLALTFAPDTVEYSLVGEILLARFEAARAVDPVLAVQAARDVEDLFKPLLAFGPRRLPALALMGRLDLLVGKREEALAFLREARLLPHTTLDERSDGALGRIAHPRLLRLALENLIVALGDDPANLDEKKKVEDELRALSSK